MPHAALWVVQLINGKVHGGKVFVSMPHAALWVVQPLTTFFAGIKARGFNAARGFVGGAAYKDFTEYYRVWSFNAARGFVGGAASRSLLGFWVHTSFNAARGFVGGAASSLSALFPLRGKRPFGKSPEI